MRLFGVVLTLGLLAGTSACSGGVDESERPRADESPSQAVDELATTLRTGQVAGKLPKQRRDATVEQIGAVVDGWIDAGFTGGEWPREIQGAYADFTDRARRQARNDAELTSAAAFSEDVDSVRATKRVVRVDLAVHERKAVGATARVVLDLETSGELEESVQVRGRLFLTPAGDGWKIFGYNLTRGGQQ